MQQTFTGKRCKIERQWVKQVLGGTWLASEEGRCTWQPFLFSSPEWQAMGKGCYVLQGVLLLHGYCLVPGGELVSNPSP